MIRRFYLAAIIACGIVSTVHAQDITPGSPTATPSIPGIAPVQHPGYIAANWYTPYPGAAIPGSGFVNPGANKVTCGFGYVAQQLTIEALGVNISTLSAANNLQLAVYNNGTWGRPSTLVVATASITTAGSGAVNGAASAQIGPGGYWFCGNMDNTTSIVMTYGIVNGIAQSTVGAALQAHAMNTTGATVGVTNAQTFGTWPTFTSGTVWADTNTAVVPLIGFQVLSVP